MAYIPFSIISASVIRYFFFDASTPIAWNPAIADINLAVEHIANFNYDIEGNTRNTPTRAGCYDPAWSITLDQEANNDGILTSFNDILVDATIKRQFEADGGWYTLVLPFDASAEQLAEAFGAGTEIAVLQNSRWKNDEHTDIYLNFAKQATVGAGVPCLIKPTVSTGTEVLFRDVVIDKTANNIETDVVNMVGLYKPTSVELSDNNYYLGAENLLYEYNSDYALTNGFRAYFHFNFDSNSQAPIRARVVFQENTTTDIEELSEPAAAPAAEKVLRDGQLIIIRDGKEYTVQGQQIR